MFFNPNFWKNKKVLVTGHTGFKGAWCTQLLNYLGANVYGLSISKKESNLVYQDQNVQRILVEEAIGDICDRHFVELFLTKIEPHYIIHLAAQSLVKQSYIDPLETFRTNIIGTAALLDVAKDLENLSKIICVTSDKCYLNEDHIGDFRECDRLGGYDPYSSSKAGAELIAKSMFDSFFQNTGTDVFTVRAGNVIGGGDVSKNRLMTDVIRSIEDETNINLRYPMATRPWQHVLEPIGAYLHLIEFFDDLQGSNFDSFNIGPTAQKNKTVSALVQEALALSNSLCSITVNSDRHEHEATTLSLDVTKLISETHWREAWDFRQTVKVTVDWYRKFALGTSAKELCERDIRDYLTKMESNDGKFN